MTDAYWHTRRGMWSVRENNRVVEHVPQIYLWDVTLVVKPDAVARVQARRVREVCGWASGRRVDIPDEDLPYRGVARVCFRPFERGEFFHGISGRSLTWCRLLMLNADGEAWGWECR